MVLDKVYPASNKPLSPDFQEMREKILRNAENARNLNKKQVER